jgi:HEAT repeat protein
MRLRFFLLVSLLCGYGAQSLGQQAQPIKTHTPSARQPDATPDRRTEKHDRKWVREEVGVMISSSCGNCIAEATWNVRRFAGRQGATPFLLEFLAKGSEKERVGAALELGSGDFDPTVAVGPLIAALADHADPVRLAAVDALGRLGDVAMPAVAPLKERLADPNANVRVHAASALWEITHREVGLLPVLLESLKHADEKVCLTAIATVREIGPNARAATPLLIELTRSSSHVLPVASATAVGKIGPDAAVAVPRLVEMLEDRSDWARVSIADALLDIQPDSEMARTALVRSLKDSSGYSWEHAATALGRHPSAARAAIPLLRGRLNDENLNTRLKAAVAFMADHTRDRPGPAHTDGIAEAKGSLL